MSKPNKDNRPKISTHHIMTVILPCVMLACKDKYDANPEELADLNKRIMRYIGFIARGEVSVKELNELMEVRDTSKDGHIEGPFTKEEIESQDKQTL